MKSKGMKYRDQSYVVNPRYISQQNVIDKTALEIGCVVFRPNYHGEHNDKNTVLFYTKEAADFNEELDKKERRGEYVPNEAYANSFWVFENTDVNGIGTYDFANRGRLDLRGMREADVIAGAIKLAFFRRKEKELVISAGGYLSVEEANEEYNDLNRKIISAFYQMHGKAFIGFVNYYGDTRKDLVERKVPVYIDYCGQPVYNFGCSFIVPEADKELAKMIVEWNAAGTEISGKMVEKITERIEKIGGINLIWY